ncbi:hypothetical protein DERP_003332 [Dermatophagoides pteronyssinus]|uniref:Uncharacterized protein n=1 Tax=Dermatophagoides pteronyssinus TaxID=6956 RepID=A0ABQ8JJR9_DERPT|nr:hypothetical protein DERP_003332 [Dermatophagoides pteronyssinus]
MDTYHRESISCTINVPDVVGIVDDCCPAVVVGNGCIESFEAPFLMQFLHSSTQQLQQGLDRFPLYMDLI